MRIAWLCFATIISSVALADTYPRLDVHDGTILPADSARGLLNQCSRGVPQNVQGTWLPSSTQISDLESRLPQALAEALKNRNQLYNPTFKIKRQYAGLIVAGHNIIYVNAFPGGSMNSDDVAHRKKAAEPVVVCDGGSSFFGVEYDPATKSFSHFEFNGRG
jgi:hypothetical protein